MGVLGLGMKGPIGVCYGIQLGLPVVDEASISVEHVAEFAGSMPRGLVNVCRPPILQ